MKKYKISPKVFILDALLLPVFGLGFVTGLIHLLRYLTESLLINKEHVVLKVGVLSNHETEVPLAKINTVSIQQGLLGKILNYGNLVIYSGNDTSGITFKGLDNPREVKQALKG